MLHVLLAIIYLAFIGLGLPDPLLGSAWPTMHIDFGVPVSYAGAISMLIAFGTVVSSLLSDRLTRRMGAGRMTAFSVAVTALSLFGFSVSRSYWLLVLLAVPYGLGAGCVDAALNNFVALHYASSHMNWLHCMWGVGTTIGPYIMGLAITNGGWSAGYRHVSLLLAGMAVILALSLPLWKRQERARLENTGESVSSIPMTLRQTCAIPGVKKSMLMFGSYCAIEQTAMLWGASYLVAQTGVSAQQAASLASLYCIGITVGRGICGFLSYKLDDDGLIRLGSAVIALGIAIMLLPLGRMLAMAGLILIGLGSAPVAPCVMHSTPKRFGTDQSQAIIGVQMASAYVGICLMPAIFGLIADWIHVGLLPVYLLALLVLMIAMHRALIRLQK